MLSESIDIDVHKRTVTLPKFSLHDFSPSRQQQPYGSAASPLEVLRCLAPYTTAHKGHQAAVQRLLSDSPNIYIRFKNISFRCRLLRKFESPSDQQQQAAGRGAGAGDGALSRNDNSRSRSSPNRNSSISSNRLRAASANNALTTDYMDGGGGSASN